MSKPISPLDIIRWRGRVGVFIKKAHKPHTAVIRLVGLKSTYRVSIHELRRDTLYKPLSFPAIKNDPLQILIKKS